jgi:Ran GTPase-activating protein (RanGAP) involved in mRNA processing and transport
VIDLCSALTSNNCLKELILAGCGFTEEAAIKVGQMLQQNTTLQALDVSNNWLGEVSSSLVKTAY